MGVCTKERKGVTAEVLMATPCTNSLGGESGGHRHEGCGELGGRSACWKFTISEVTLSCIGLSGKRLEPTSKTSKAIVPLSLRLNLAT